ncbi:restriction endonuclease subunit S [Pirellulaceae bacterium SH449]
MIDGLKPYAEYKESGLPWVGKIPAHWDAIPNRGLVRKRKVLVGKNHVKYQLLSLTKQGVIVRDISTGKGKFSSDMGTSQEVRIGDFVFCLFDVPETPRAVGLSHHNGMITGAYTVLEYLVAGNPAYFEKFYLAMDDRKLLSPLYSGLRHTIPIERFLGAKTPQPPPDEQAAIVRFLDYANGKIERAIRAKRKLIGLLNEQKQAIIHRAVTRGLDPNVKLKPSGIPWLGDVPEHWSLKRFKYLATINSGQVDPRKAKYRNLTLIAPNHIRSGTGQLINLETASEQGADSGKYLVSRGQIIYSKIRPNLRKATIAPCDCLCSADMYPISAKKEEISPDYLLFLLLSQPFTKFAVDSSMRVAMPKVNREALANCYLWFPNLDEQSKILEFIAHKLVPFEIAIVRTEHEIILLREYRTSLTADVVTGKLDVRKITEQLPEQIDEPHHTDDSLGESIDDELLEEIEA